MEILKSVRVMGERAASRIATAMIERSSLVRVEPDAWDVFEIFVRPDIWSHLRTLAGPDEAVYVVVDNEGRRGFLGPMSSREADIVIGALEAYDACEETQKVRNIPDDNDSVYLMDSSIQVLDSPLSKIV